MLATQAGGPVFILQTHVKSTVEAGMGRDMELADQPVQGSENLYQETR